MGRRQAPFEAAAWAIRRADDALAAVVQRFVDAKASSGVPLPAILRDAVFHSMASVCLGAAVSAFDGNYAATVMLSMLIACIGPREVALWKQHALRAGQMWTPAVAQACFSEAERRRRYFLPFRIAFLLLNAWNCYASAAYPVTVTDVACMVMVAVFTARLYLERARPAELQPEIPAVTVRTAEPA